MFGARCEQGRDSSVGKKKNKNKNKKKKKKKSKQEEVQTISTMTRYHNWKGKEAGKKTAK